MVGIKEPEEIQTILLDGELTLVIQGIMDGRPLAVTFSDSALNRFLEEIKEKKKKTMADKIKGWKL